MSLSMDARLEYLQRAARAWLAYKRAVDALPDAALERPNTVGPWSGRDVIAHVATWEDEALRVIAAMDAGGPEAWPDTPDGPALDAWNEAHVAPFRALSTPELRQFADDTHTLLMNLAERSPAAGPRIAAELTEGHCGEHLEQLRALAQRR
jgi:hypothetical protein